VKIVRDFYEQIWNDGTLSAIDQVVSDHRVDHDPDAGGSGRLDIAEAVQRYRTAFPDLSFTFGPQFADGDLVATVWQATGNHTGPLDQIPATSRRAVVAGIFVDRLAGGQIVESWTSYDRLGLLQQLGVLPTI
jgi:predicted ester cyclase